MKHSDRLQSLADFLSGFYTNVSIRKNKIIILEQSDPYIIRITKNGVRVRRWWDNIYLLAMVALLLYTLEEIVLAIAGLHLQAQTKFYIWLAAMSISTLLIARDNRCQRKIKSEIKEGAQKFLAQYRENQVDTTD